MDLPGFRRRILIEPSRDRVRAELEDDWHWMAVSLTHVDGTITGVDAEMKRAPWSSCPGAVERLQATFLGVQLADVARGGEKTTNCTHLHDLALFAAAHVGDGATTAYDIAVSDPVADTVHALLNRNGTIYLAWTLVAFRITSPADLAGRRLIDLGDWIAASDPTTREAARVLRWAAIMSQGRLMAIEAGSTADTFPLGACYTFQPERAALSRRVARAWTDFSVPSSGPMADRLEAFVGPPSRHKKLLETSPENESTHMQCNSSQKAEMPSSLA